MVLKVPAKASQSCYYEQAGDTVSLWKDMVEQSHLANNGGRRRMREGEKSIEEETKKLGKGYDPQRHDSKYLPPVSMACLQRFPSVHSMPLNHKYISGLVH